MPSHADVPKLLGELATALAGHRWYLFGAQALAFYGVPRSTADVDVTVEWSGPPTGLVALLERHGFRARVRDVEDFVARARVVPFLHEETRLPVDVVLAGSGLEDEFLGRRNLRDVQGMVVPVLSREDLVIAKILAGRPQDLEDVRSLLGTSREGLDRRRIESVLAALEEALDVSDLLPRWTSLSAGKGKGGRAR